MCSINISLLILAAAGISVMATAGTTAASSRFDYADALSKSILFFEGQRSGRLPPSQRMTWRKSSALRDGFDVHVSHPLSLSKLTYNFDFFLP